MRLAEIIDINGNILNGISDYKGISFEDLLPYKKALTTYYKNLWPRGNDVVFVATFVTNACCAGVLAPSNELGEVFDVLTSELEGEDETVAIFDVMPFKFKY
jgi:hypothetical protein